MVASISLLYLCDFCVFFELFSLDFRARLVPSILRCLGSDLLVGIMYSCLVHLCT
jgi:hypothetical protein